MSSGVERTKSGDTGAADAAWWNRLDLRHLQCFIALAEEMHFGRAAHRLRMAQPVLSRKIARLETDIGGQLFDRTRSQIKLTAAGVTLLPRARDLMLRLRDMADATRRVASGGLGLLEIGFVSSATFSILPELVRDYHERYPLVDLRLRHMHMADLFHALIERRIHVAFTRPGIDDAEIMNDLVLREKMMAALPEGDPLAKATRLTVRDLADRPFIIPTAVDDHIRKIFAGVSFHPKVVQEPSDLHTALSLVAAGLGLALVPESARHSPRQGVVYRPLTEPAIYTEFMISYRHDNTDQVLQNFRALVRQRKKKPAERPTAPSKRG